MNATHETANEFVSTGMTTGRAPGPIGGPGAWRGLDMAKRVDEWTYTLSTTEVQELDEAMRRTRRIDFLDIDKIN